MPWRKRGLVFVPPGDLPWARTHAFLPTPSFENGVLRIYVAFLDNVRVGRVGAVDVDPDDPTRVVGVTKEPLLGTGELGAFDDNGVNPSCVVRIGDSLFLYYIGWQLTRAVPHLLFTGLAVRGDDSDRFVRATRVPVLDRTQEEPFSRSAPYVLPGKNSLIMWYWTCVYWSIEGGTARYHSVIKYAESDDGYTWKVRPETCVAPSQRGDFAVGRPWVLAVPGGYEMWYSIRSSDPERPYRIAHALSRDGIDWQTDDFDVLPRSKSGWDSEMVCFAAVADVRGRRFMFYNGNRHGLTGFGCAELAR